MGPMKETDQEDMSGGMTCGEEGPPIGIVAGTEIIQQKQNPGWDVRPVRAAGSAASAPR